MGITIPLSPRSRGNFHPVSEVSVPSLVYLVFRCLRIHCNGTLGDLTIRSPVFIYPSFALRIHCPVLGMSLALIVHTPKAPDIDPRPIAAY